MEQYMSHVTNFPEESGDFAKCEDHKKEYIERIRKAVEIDRKRDKPKIYEARVVSKDGRPGGCLSVDGRPIADYVIDPTLIDKRGKKYFINDCYGVRLLIPGSDYSWESMYHLEYFMLCVIRTTETYEVMYDIKGESEIRIMMNKFTDKNKIVGLACQIRDSDKTMSNRILNSICHCVRDIDKTPDHIRLSKHQSRLSEYFRGEWTKETFDSAKEHLIEILENNQHLIPLLEDKKASLYAHKLDILWKINGAMLNITDLNSKKMYKIEDHITRAGGTLDYINQHGYLFWGQCCVLEITQDLYNELRNKLDANWTKLDKRLRKDITTIKNKHLPLVQNKLREVKEHIKNLPTTFTIPGMLETALQNNFEGQ